MLNRPVVEVNKIQSSPVERSTEICRMQDNCRDTEWLHIYNEMMMFAWWEQEII